MSATTAIRTSAGSPDDSMKTLLAAIDSTAGVDEGGKVILFTSAHTGEGKTTVVDTLARYVAGRRHTNVAAIDAGLRGDLSRRLAPASAIELTALVAPGAETTLSQQRGKKTNEPVLIKVDRSALVKESDMFAADAVQRLRELFDYVFIEMPSFADDPGSLISARNFDGAIMVVESGLTRWPAVKHALIQIESVGVPIIGVFLNKREYVIPQKVYAWL